LRNHDYPGNVRELINKINNAVSCNRSGMLQLEDFMELTPVASKVNNLIRRIGSDQFILYGIFPEFPTLDEVEQLLVDKAMSEASGNRSAAAELLGISRPTLQRKMSQLHDGTFKEKTCLEFSLESGR
jgi:DNA-binding NtrC family response regulator